MSIFILFLVWYENMHAFGNRSSPFKTSRSLKFVDFGTNRKRACNFL